MVSGKGGRLWFSGGGSGFRVRVRVRVRVESGSVFKVGANLPVDDRLALDGREAHDSQRVARDWHGVGRTGHLVGVRARVRVRVKMRLGFGLGFRVSVRGDCHRVQHSHLVELLELLTHVGRDYGA